MSAHVSTAAKLVLTRCGAWTLCSYQALTAADRNGESTYSVGLDGKDEEVLDLELLHDGDDERRTETGDLVVARRMLLGAVLDIGAARRHTPEDLEEELW
jgi:hypothetical protein